ncbi:two-component system response regulator DcuR [Pectobacterium sp. B1J-3]|uniref:two-component system response regulator DcuR n=1 Tax=Pectobacterium sp. B1J-3 TaxID=3385371 RepID=UPI003906286C
MINVLIVDPDTKVAALNRTYLNQISGFNCYATVSTLQQARNLLIRHASDIDLVLLDICTQRNSDLALLRVIRELSKRTDVIIVSSTHDLYTIKKGLRYGAVGYLVKPFQFSRFEYKLTAYREEVNLLKHQEVIVQNDIDYLIQGISNKNVSKHKRLPKGLTSHTLRIICEWVKKNQDVEFSTKMMSDAIGISSVSCRKYLSYLEDTHILATDLLYQTKGRPVHLYRLLAEQRGIHRQVNSMSSIPLKNFKYCTRYEKISAHALFE